MYDDSVRPVRMHVRSSHFSPRVYNCSRVRRPVGRCLRMCVFTLAAILVMSAPARAEVTVGVNVVTELSALVVYCRTEIKDGMVRYRVLETWKGEYRPDLFYDPPSSGYLYTGEWHGNDNPFAGREVVFFFSAESQSGKIEGKYSDHMTAHVVTNGKVTVPARRGFTGQTEEWTLADFRKVVLASVRYERAVVAAATAGSWVAALAVPSFPDPVAPLPSNSRLVQHDAPASDATPTPPGRTTAAGLWWALAAVLLCTGLVLGWRAHHRRSAKSS